MLDEASIEALMVVMSFDGRKMLLCVGIVALGTELGTIATMAETLAHQHASRLGAASVLDRGIAYWRAIQPMVRQVMADKEVSDMRDARLALERISADLVGRFPGFFSASSAGLIAACAIQRATLEGYLSERQAS